MRELASSSTGLPTYLPRGQDAGVAVPPTAAETAPAGVPPRVDAAVAPEDRHRLTHLPYSAQCGVCIAAKARDCPHRRVEKWP
eukprot:4898526-Heterocapsa_arctica.AAC.1